MTDDAGGEGSDEGGDDTGESQDDNQNNDQSPADPTDNLSDEDQKNSEQQIYDTLTDEQKRIRVLELKINFKDLYEETDNVLRSINNIPKTNENIDRIRRIIIVINKVKKYLVDFIGTNFDMNSYIDNYSTYIKFVSVFRTITKVINEINNENSKK